MGFTFKVETSGSGQDDFDEGNVTYTQKRITFDNKYFTNIQIKDVSSLLTEDCVLGVDSDTIPFMAASLQDDNYVTVSHPSWEEDKEFKTKTDFKGAARKEGVITQKSWLGIENMKLAAAGKEEYKLEDFEIVQNKRLKFERDKAMGFIKKYIDDYVSGIKFQAGCDKVFCYLGSGDNHRHLLHLPVKYKEARNDNERPILLKEARDYLTTNYPSEVVVGREADDKVQQFGWEGWLHYKKTGKFNKYISLLDKDGYQAPCLLFSYKKAGPKWLHPNPVLINSTNEGVGEIEMVGSDCKATALMQVCYQILTGDSSDGYHPYLKFPKDMHPETPYSDAGFFKEFFMLKTPTECLQKVVDRYLEWFPTGLQYSSWNESQIDIDTLSWLSMMFECVYMLRSENDKTKIEDLLQRFKVDYSKIVGNNKPVEEVVPTITVDKNFVDSLVGLLSDTSGKVADKNVRKEEVILLLNSLWNNKP